MTIITSVRQGLLIVVEMQLIACAPKIGPILFDPLIYESVNSIRSATKRLDYPERTQALRTESSSEKAKPCQGYDYDITQCKYVNDRKICGYNKNIGELKSDEITDAGNGCQIRNGRLECGYLNGPFEGIRRPPPDDSNAEAISTEKMKLSSRTLRNGSFENKSNTIVDIGSTTDDSDIEIKVKTRNTPTVKGNTSDISTTRNNVKRYKYCVDKNDRIFCYTVIKY